MATCIDVAKAEYPKTSETVEPLVGKSLLPVFRDEERDGHDFLYFQFSSNRAVMKDNWKLVTHKASSWELYDIEKDGTEMNDLSDEYPEKVKELSELWHKTAKNVDRLTKKGSGPVSGKKPPSLAKDGRVKSTKKQ